MGTFPFVPKELKKNIFTETKTYEDVKEDLEGFKKYYLKNIDELRDVKEALPK